MHDMKLTILTIGGFKYIHAVMQPSPLSVSRTFHVAKLNLLTR